MPRTKKKVKSIVKTKVISARVTETVHELLHQQAEDAGMTLSQFAAQMLMKGRVNWKQNSKTYRLLQTLIRFWMCTVSIENWKKSPVRWSWN